MMAEILSGMRKRGLINKHSIWLVAGILLFASLLFANSYTGFAVFEDTVTFDLNESWNISNGFVRVNLNSQMDDKGLDELVSDNKVVVDLNDFNISYEEGRVYADLIVDGVVVDSKSFVVSQESFEDDSLAENNRPADESIGVPVDIENLTLGNEAIAENASLPYAENLTSIDINLSLADINIISGKFKGELNSSLGKQKVILKLSDKSRKGNVMAKLNSQDSIDGSLVFAEVDDISSLASDADVLEVWPDRETMGFLNDSVPQINAPVQWDSGYYGNNVTIAILDTGVNASHPMLDGKVILSRDFTGSDDANDYNGHGTHIAGIVAGNSGYKGVATNARILNGKVLNDYGSGQLSWLIDAIDWAMDPDGNPLTDDGADIISLSLGATYSGSPEALLSSPEVLKVEEAVSRGIVVVIASGNCGQGCNGFVGVTTPGIARNAITVGAVDESNNHAYFSSGMAISDYIKPDVVAPGVDVCSSYASEYMCLSGTSMSTPHVAGAGAIILEKHPEYSPSDVKAVLEANAVDLGMSGKDVEFGSGLVDLTEIEIGSQVINPANDYWLEMPAFRVGARDDIVLVYNNSGDEGKKVKVNFDIEEFESHEMGEIEKEVPEGKSKEFRFGWEPSLIGKHVLNIEIFVDDALYSQFEAAVPVGSEVKDSVVNNQVMWR